MLPILAIPTKTKAVYRFCFLLCIPVISDLSLNINVVFRIKPCIAVYSFCFTVLFFGAAVFLLLAKKTCQFFVCPKILPSVVGKKRLINFFSSKILLEL